MKPFASVLLAALLTICLSAQLAHAEPTVRVITKTYDITGTTAAQLKAEMRRKGPEGYWAYARWWVNWSADCRLSVRITYTMPNWVNSGEAPAKLRATWNRMIRQLRIHERGHGQHGINAAREIEKTQCHKPMKIIDKWAAQDKIYDRQTKHGLTQGVHLP